MRSKLVGAFPSLSWSPPLIFSTGTLPLRPYSTAARRYQSLRTGSFSRSSSLWSHARQF